MSLKLFKKVFHLSAQRYLKTAGDLFIYQSDYVGALDLVEKSLKVEPNDGRALVLYGDILFCLNRDVEALQAFNKAIDINSRLAEAYISKAGVLEVMGKYGDALRCCEKALTLISAERHYLLSSLYDQKIMLLIRLKRYRTAQQVLKNASVQLGDEDFGYLNSCYKSLLDQLCAKRRTTREKANQLTLCILDNMSQQAYYS